MCNMCKMTVKYGGCFKTRASPTLTENGVYAAMTENGEYAAMTENQQSIISTLSFPWSFRCLSL